MPFLGRERCSFTGSVNYRGRRLKTTNMKSIYRLLEAVNDGQMAPILIVIIDAKLRSGRVSRVC